MWGIPYTSSFTPENINQHFGEWPPNLRESKQLNEAFVQLLAQVLGPSSSVYFSGSIENGDYHWVDDFPANWLEEGIVADLIHIYHREGQFPGYTFNLEHTWCLLHMEFANYVVLGCPVSIAEKVGAISAMEVLYLH